MYRKYSLGVLHKKEGNENCTLFCWLVYLSLGVLHEKILTEERMKGVSLVFWLKQFQSNEGMGKLVQVYRNETTIRDKLEHKLEIKL